MVSVDVKHHVYYYLIQNFRAQELYESRGGRPGLSAPNSPYGLCGRKATLNWNSDTRSCVKVEVAVLGSPSQIVRTVCVDVHRQFIEVGEEGDCIRGRLELERTLLRFLA